MLQYEVFDLNQVLLIILIQTDLLIVSENLANQLYLAYIVVVVLEDDVQVPCHNQLISGVPPNKIGKESIASLKEFL